MVAELLDPEPGGHTPTPPPMTPDDIVDAEIVDDEDSK